jgi:hypothetical protein
MIKDTFNFLQSVLEGHFKKNKIKIKIDLLDQASSSESISFPNNQITPILINIERENQMRAPNQFARVLPDGKRLPILPDVRVNLLILFVARFNRYETALTSLGLILEFFQSNPIFNHENSEILDKIDESNRKKGKNELNQLIVELISLPLSEQNEVWNALRSAYQPSLLYRVRLLGFMSKPDTPAKEVKEIEIRSEHLHDSL